MKVILVAFIYLVLWAAFFAAGVAVFMVLFNLIANWFGFQTINFFMAAVIVVFSIAVAKLAKLV